jgi:hypothetical protein
MEKKLNRRKHFVTIGERFGKVVVVKELESRDNYKRYVECLCDCGNPVVLQYNTLRKSVKLNRTPSCGCVKIRKSDLSGFERDESLMNLPYKEKRELIIKMINEGHSNVQIESKLGLYRGKVTEIRQQIGLTLFKPTKEYPVGEKFNLLTIVGTYRGEDGKSYGKVICNCDCGTKNFVARYNHLKNGDTKSCGCFIKNLAKEMMYNTLIPNCTVHGDSKNSEQKYIYNIWVSAKQRCYNPNNKRYPTYGKMGITMYEEWINNYPLFKEYILTNLGERPKGKTTKKSDNYSIDRIDVTKGYEPGNLRWATFVEQANNKHKTKS